jgi:hypothetical protein
MLLVVIARYSQPVCPKAGLWSLSVRTPCAGSETEDLHHLVRERLLVIIRFGHQLAFFLQLRMALLHATQRYHRRRTAVCV